MKISKLKLRTLKMYSRLPRACGIESANHKEYFQTLERLARLGTVLPHQKPLLREMLRKHLLGA